MLMDFLKSLNWVDILMAVVFARSIFIGIKSGFIVEFFKFFGVLFSTVITLHYYSILADLLAPHARVFEPTALRMLVFLGLWLTITALFKFIRDGLLLLFTIQPHPYIEKFVGAGLAAMRGLLVCSLVFFVLLVSQNTAVLKLSEKSISKNFVSHLAPHIYASCYWGVILKFFPMEPMNKEAMAVPRLIERKKK
jgi:uncharacterized membrane protein required for colicin V production